MGCSPTVANPCARNPTGRQTTPGDDGAARRAREAEAASAAAAAAEQQRREEAERIERNRLAEEKRKKDAEFIRNRDATASTLRGAGIGTAVTPNDGLRGSGGVDTGLRELRGGDRAARDLQGPQAAWKQLHCAASLSGYAMAALSKPMPGDATKNFQEPDYQEFSFLAKEASNAFNGQALGVECPAAPPFPDSSGRAVDLEKVTEAGRKILDRAVVIAERMKQRGDRPAVAPAPAHAVAKRPRTRLRRVQRDLNQVNSRQITGRTRQEIDQQEKDRKELANLVLPTIAWRKAN